MAASRVNWTLTTFRDPATLPGLIRHAECSASHTKCIYRREFRCFCEKVLLVRGKSVNMSLKDVWGGFNVISLCICLLDIQKNFSIRLWQVNNHQIVNHPPYSFLKDTVVVAFAELPDRNYFLSRKPLPAFVIVFFFEGNTSIKTWNRNHHHHTPPA